MINAFIALCLMHFPAKSVVECIFTLRNLLKFLRYGEATTFAPRNSVTIIYDVFKGTSVTPFRAYMQHLQDFKLGNTSAVMPESIFEHAQTKYNELILADKWVPMKKKPAAFLAGKYEETEIAEQKSGKKKSPKNDNGKKDPPKKDAKGRFLFDRMGRPIDRTPPKKGEPHERTNEKGFKEYYCSAKECERWGNHSTNQHKLWLENRKNWFNNGIKNKDGDETQANAAASKPKGAVTFLSALTCGAVSVDPDMIDGIDI